MISFREGAFNDYDHGLLKRSNTSHISWAPGQPPNAAAHPAKSWARSLVHVTRLIYFASYWLSWGCKVFEEGRKFMFIVCGRALPSRLHHEPFITLTAMDYIAIPGCWGYLKRSAKFTITWHHFTQLANLARAYHPPCLFLFFIMRRFCMNLSSLSVFWPVWSLESLNRKVAK